MEKSATADAHINQLRLEIETRLRITMPEDISAALADGVILCHVANHVRPRAVPSIHVPSPSVVSQGLLDLDGRNSQKYLHQTWADF